MIHSCVFLFSDGCSVESLVCPEQLNFLLFFRKIFQLPRILWFSSIFVFWTLSNNDYDFEIQIFTPRTTEGLICNYYRRFKHSLMLQKKKLALFDFEDQGKCNLICLLENITIFCSFWRAVLNEKKYDI